MYEDFVLRKNGAQYFTSPLLDSFNVPHMFTTKNGGVSSGPFESLNMSPGQGQIKDTHENVERNHQIAANALSFSHTEICRTHQMHTTNIEIVTENNKEKDHRTYIDGVDGLVTNQKGILLSARTADCVPVLLYDTINASCAAIHSGWRGTLGGIVHQAIQLMCENFGSKPESIIAAIGPAANSCCYEVGEEVFEAFVAQCSDFAAAFEWRGDKLYLRLHTIIAHQLKSKGLYDKNISISRLCTICTPALFYSHRRQGTVRGTMAAFIGLK